MKLGDCVRVRDYMAGWNNTIGEIIHIADGGRYSLCVVRAASDWCTEGETIYFFERNLEHLPI
jgi:hypothetical protein